MTFTQNLQRHVAVAPREVRAETLGDALEQVFAEVPALRGYVVDDQGGLRRHVTAFVDGEVVADRISLSDPLRPDSDVRVMQALSGG